MKSKLLSLLLAGGMLLGCAACSPSQAPVEEDGEILISLSDSGISVDGQDAFYDSNSPTGDHIPAVYTGAEIIYYKDGTDESYGEGEEHEKHSAEEAAAHTVVTITRPGTYRLTGTLSRGQIAVDLGAEAESDPNAVVTLILDNADVTCTVAPALIFYNVYECGTVDTENASPDVDTSAAGANVILAAGSENNFTGSHVARIYKEGTEEKLHKYDGAFYSKMSMNINGDTGDDSGVLNIVADNEGLCSELHLTLNGGTVNISARDDGINTNEDDVSVTTVNGGTLTVDAGQGSEGDGIDSNGYLTVNGGTVWTMSNERSPDGGIDADLAITLNGGTLYAFGTRNDAADSASVQPYMELSFASTLPAGSAVKLTDAEGNEIWSAVTEKTCQSVTLTTPELALDTPYHLYVDDVLQCYSSAGAGGGRHPGGMGGPRPEGMEPPADFDPGQMTPPEGMESPDGEGRPGGMKDRGDMDLHEILEEMPEEMIPEGYTREDLLAMSEEELKQLYGRITPGLPPEGFEPGMHPGGGAAFPGADSDEAKGTGATEFILTAEARSFSGICDSESSGKIPVSFAVAGTEGGGREVTLPAITSITPSVELDPSQIQITVTDSPSEDYSESCLWAEGAEAVNELLPEDPGSYLLTVAVISGNGEYTGATQISFTVPE